MFVQEVLYLSALLAMKKAESQDKVVNLLSKTVELHLGAIRVGLLTLTPLYLMIVTVFLMAALWNRAGHNFFVLRFLLSIFFCLLFFLAYSQPSQTGCLPYFHTWCALSANLGCRSETCCMRLAENTGRKKFAICAPSHNFVGLCLHN